MIRDDGTPIVCYGKPGDELYHAWYRVCPICGRFVKPDDRTKIPEYQGNKPNATCKKCGRVQMDFCTWLCE